MEKLFILSSILVFFLMTDVAKSAPAYTTKCSSEQTQFGSIIAVVNPPHKIIEKNLDSPWLRFMYQPTRRSTIDKFLTFKSGELFDKVKLQESIRKLRSQKFIWDATVEVVPTSSCKNNIVITVHDTFPFKPKLSLSRRSSTNSSGIGVVNTNVFGTGNSLKFEFKKEKLRDQKIIRYINPNFGEQNYAFTGLYSDNSDGRETLLSIKKPFHALDTPNSYQLFWNDFNGDLQLFNNAQLAIQSPYSLSKTHLGYAWSNQAAIGFQRSRLGFELTNDEASYVNFSQYDRRVVGLAVKWRLFDTDFLEVKNVRNMTQFEDFNQGMSFSVGMNFEKDQNSGIDGVKLSAELNKTIAFSDYEILVVDSTLDSRQMRGLLGETNFTTRLEYNRFSKDNNESWNAKFKVDITDNPYPEHLKLMDEEFSIRGFPYGYRLADSVVSVNLEKRWFNLAHFFDSFDVAGAAFVDAGRISLAKSDMFEGDTTMLKSVGFGFRISPTQWSHNTVIHVDFAFPFADDIEKGVQINVFALEHF